MTTRRRLLGFASASVAAGIGVLTYRRTRPRSPHVGFGGNVPDDVRERSGRVADRLPALVGSELRDPVRIRTVSSDRIDRSPLEPETAAGRIVAAARHLDDFDGDDLPRPAGTYDAANRTILLAESVASEPLIAHELTHAIQHDRVDRPVPNARDRTDAIEAVWEGTATYAERRYGADCRSRTVDPCEPDVDRTIRDVGLPETLAAGGHLYAIGAGFADALVAHGGWDALWDVHRSPPSTTHSVLFPGRFLRESVAPAAIGADDATPVEWFDVVSDRLGAVALYAKLVALGLIEPDIDEGAPATTVDWSRTEFGASVVRNWRGDRLRGYQHVDDLDRLGYVWRVRWATIEAAATIERLVTGGYERRGRPAGEGWYFEDRYVDVRRRGATVAFTMAPTRVEHRELFADLEVG